MAVTVKLSSLFNDQTLTASGVFASGYKLFTYAAGSSTKQATYTDNTGTSAQTNPIILNASGSPASPIWLAAGQAYKFVLALPTDSDPPASPVKVIDNVSGINDSSQTASQWVSSGVTPTYINATTFTLVGDQTTDFHIGRRLQFAVTAGTVYGTIATSVYSTLTTVTVSLDSGSLDSGLSTINLSLLRNDHLATPSGVAKSGALASSGITGAAASGANNDITSLGALTTPLGGMRNRIINGDMRIDQRNNGVAVTPAAGAYTLDRWLFGLAQASKLSCQQVTDAPPGFSHSAKLTVLSAYAPAGNELFTFQTRIEGYNVADLAFGTASAKSSTLSFWVKASVTGVYPIVLTNLGGTNFNLNSSFTINAASTWEKKTVQIPADTVDALASVTSGIGLILNFGLGGAGTSVGVGTGAWQAQAYYQVTAGVSWINNAAATFQVTGVQLEPGAVATVFEPIEIGELIRRCQRYLPAILAATGNIEPIGLGQALSTTQVVVPYAFQVPPRVPPTGISVSNVAHFATSATNGVTTSASAVSMSQVGKVCATLSFTTTGVAAGNASIVYSQSASAQILFTGCEL